MSLPKMFLRQRSSLSFFATTFIIALTTQSSLAFSITQIGQGNNIGYWDPKEEYTLTDESKKGTTTLDPTIPISISRGGTEEFLHTLRKAFPTWNFTRAAKDLAGSFEVKEYDAVGSYDLVGAKFQLLYKPGNNDPTPQDSTLHWIQRVVNNHSLTPDEHGNNADIIDKPPETNNPYYPWHATVLGFKQFKDFSRRPDADQNHNWLAELYLVKETEPQQVTIYNGVQWGWKNEVVPEPLTIFGSGVGLGLGVFFKKKVHGSTRKQKISKS